MEVFIVNSGRCTGGGGNCGKPAAYKQLLPGKKDGFLFCEEHASKFIKKIAKQKAEEQAKQGTKK